MPSASDHRVIQLLAQFADLGATEQATFLDALNVYLYTSPQQRRMLRSEWAGAAACSCAEPQRKA